MVWPRRLPRSVAIAQFLGLRDMHGNVAEVVADHYVPGQPRLGGTDPLVIVKKDGLSQIRGGAAAHGQQSTFRGGFFMASNTITSGFGLC